MTVDTDSIWKRVESGWAEAYRPDRACCQDVVDLLDEVQRLKDVLIGNGFCWKCGGYIDPPSQAFWKEEWDCECGEHYWLKLGDWVQ